MSKYIPNTFQTANAVVDELMPLLTDSELRVLLYMIRHIIGWTSRVESKRGRISLSSFVDGFTLGDGDKETIYPGCGLTRTTVVTALNGLKKYQVVTQVSTSQKGTEWELAFMTTDKVDKAGLTIRAESKSSKIRKKTVSARKKAAETVKGSNGKTTDEGSLTARPEWSNGKTTVVYGLDPSKHNSKPSSKSNNNSPASAAIPDADIPFAKHDLEIDAAAEEERQAQPDAAMPELEWEPMEKAVGQVFKAFGAKAKHLINMLWGRSKTGKWAAGNLDQPMPHSELLRFGNWYKSSQSAWRDPSSLTAEDIQSLVIQFRLEVKKKQELATMPEPEGAQGPNDPTAWMAKPVTTDEAKRSA